MKVLSYNCHAYSNWKDSWPATCHTRISKRLPAKIMVRNIAEQYPDIIHLQEVDFVFIAEFFDSKINEDYTVFFNKQMITKKNYSEVKGVGLMTAVRDFFQVVNFRTLPLFKKRFALILELRKEIPQSDPVSITCINAHFPLNAREKLPECMQIIVNEMNSCKEDVVVFSGDTNLYRSEYKKLAFQYINEAELYYYPKTDIPTFQSWPCDSFQGCSTIDYIISNRETHTESVTFGIMPAINLPPSDHAMIVASILL